MTARKKRFDKDTVLVLAIFGAVIAAVIGGMVYVWSAFATPTVWNAYVNIAGYSVNVSSLFGAGVVLYSVVATAKLIRRRIAYFWAALGTIVSVILAVVLYQIANIWDAALYAGLTIPLLLYSLKKTKSRSENAEEIRDSPFAKVVGIAIAVVIAAYNPLFTSPALFVAVAAGQHGTFWLSLLFSRRGEKDREAEKYVEPIAKRMGIKKVHVIVAEDDSFVNAMAFWSLRGYLLIFPKLMSIMSKEQYSGVIAHELAHLKYKHNIVSIGGLIGLVGVGIFVVPAIGMPFWAYILMASVLFIYVSKLLEMHADRVACRVVGGETFASSMKALQQYLKIKEEKSDSKFNLYLPASHPPFSYRIATAEKFASAEPVTIDAQWPPAFAPAMEPDRARGSTKSGKTILSALKAPDSEKLIGGSERCYLKSPDGGRDIWGNVYVTSQRVLFETMKRDNSGAKIMDVKSQPHLSRVGSPVKNGFLTYTLEYGSLTLNFATMWTARRVKDLIERAQLPNANKITDYVD